MGVERISAKVAQACEAGGRGVEAPSA